jgi:hypothetical protein
MLKQLGRLIVRYLTQPHATCTAGMPTSTADLEQAARAGDVLLVEGRERISAAIKYLTQSTWSHAALCIGPDPASDQLQFVETDAAHGVRLVGAAHYQGYHLRLCRPVGLGPDEVGMVCDFARSRVGHGYDVRNIVDLARYLLPTPPVPLPWRRRMIALGSGDPTKAICSTLIAQAFEAAGYPVLPTVTRESAQDPDCEACVRDILHIRHHSLYTPRDFDVSPYFEVIKPALTTGFDHRTLTWAHPHPA